MGRAWLAGTAVLVLSCCAETDKGGEAMEAKAFLAGYQEEFARLRGAWTAAMWRAANSGRREEFQAQAEADLALRRFHADPERLRRLEALLEGGGLGPQERRVLEVALLEARGQQLPPATLAELARRGAEIEELYSTFRGELAGERLANNELLGRLARERDTSRRKSIWEALKQVGAAVGPKLVALARLRNEAARSLGFADYWEMTVRLQEHDPARLLGLFAELDRLTLEPFRRMKEELDGELSRRFGLAPADLRPWHYDNPFFQAAPPAEAVDLDEFYRQMRREDLVGLAERFFARLGLPVAEVLSRSDLYEREGKDQNAFCEDLDRAGDVRILANVRPTAEWMDTLLHELGHAVFDLGLDRRLPFNLRRAGHILATEGVAMLFGALAKTPEWLAAWAGAEGSRVASLAGPIREQRRREQLIFARWSLAMVGFERELYRDPDQDLDRLWWDLVERYQLLRRPEGRRAPDWAAKQHFTIAPVYYHNYQLGELFAAQLRAALGRGAWGPEQGGFLRDRVFRPGLSRPWPSLLKEATGEELSPRAFAAEIGR